MKKYYYIFLLIFLSTVYAKPVIDVAVEPQELWLNDKVMVSFNCSDGDSPIQKIEVMFLEPIMIPNSSLDIQKSDNYYFYLDLVYPYPGRYEFQIYCESNNTEENSTLDRFDFFVHNVSAVIESIKPGKIYEGDEIKAYVRIKKDDVDLNASDKLTFKIFLDGLQIQPSTPIYYESSKGWVISFFAGVGKHKLKILASLDEKEIEMEKEIIVQKSIELSFLNIDKTEVFSDDVVTLKFLAREREYKIDNSSLSISVLLDGANVTFNYSVIDSLDGSLIEIKVKMPKLDVGEHTLSTRVSYKGESLKKEVKVINPLKVEGRFVNHDGLVFNGKIKFKKDGFEKVLSTNSSGYFSGFVPKGEYDLELEIKDYPNYPGAKIVLNNAKIEAFDDKIVFDVLRGVNIEGLGLGGVYLIEMNLSFSKAKLELVYEKRKILNESEIIVYKCEDWNFAKMECNGELEEIDAVIDKDKNVVRFEQNSFSVFIISYRKRLLLNLMTDKKNYNLKDAVMVFGYVQDDEGRYLEDVGVSIRFYGGNAYFAKTDKNGYFSQQLIAPDREGIFRIDVKAEKSKFIPDEKTAEINVTKSRKLVLFIDDSYRVYEGENITIPLKIINTGQADIPLARINISGLPENFRIISNKDELDIKSGEERESPIKIFAPENSTSNNIIRISLYYDGVYVEKQILLFVEKRPKPMPTARVILPKIEREIIYTVLSCLLIIGVAYILKKNKRMRKQDNILKEIKSEIIK